MAQWKPTPEEEKKWWDNVLKEWEADYLKKNPIAEDITEKRCDSIFLTLINNYRQEMGLGKVVYMPVLDSASRLHTKWLLKYDTICHTEIYPNIDGNIYRNPTDRIEKFDPTWENTFQKVKENCGINATIGTGPFIKYKRINDNSIDEVFKGWVNSPGHKAALVTPNARYLGFYIASKFNPKSNHYSIVATMLITE